MQVETYLYTFDWADDQIIAGMVEMISSLEIKPLKHTSVQNFVEACWSFDLSDEENFNEIFSLITKQDWIDRFLLA